MRKLTTEDFIQKARLKHEDKYDYSKSVYINSRSKIEIICPIHGSFWQNAGNHMNSGNGCPSCQTDMQSIEDFKRLAREVHGNKYDYSKSKYQSNKVKVEVVCPVHGSFWQSPHNHVRQKSNCPVCANKRKTKREFIEKARKTHGDKYDYTNSIYVNGDVPIEIYCKEHNITFTTRPSEHYKFSGCPECKKDRIPTTHDWIERYKNHTKSAEVDYSKINYSGVQEPMTFICPKHGEYQQRPFHHLKSLEAGYTGCTDCYRADQTWIKPPVYYRMDREANVYLVTLSDEEDEWLKVGVAVNPNLRLRKFEKDGFEVIDVELWKGPAKEIWSIESCVHSSVFHKFQKDDWDWGGRTECYSSKNKQEIRNLIDEMANLRLGVFKV